MRRSELDTSAVVRRAGRARRAATAVTAALALLSLTVVWAPSASAAPKLTVSATSGLTDGQTITVSGVGFTADLKGIAVGQCKVGYAGPSDCNLQGGATFRNADGSGSIGTITLKLATSFGGIDCTTTDCVIAAAPTSQLGRRGDRLGEHRRSSRSPSARPLRSRRKSRPKSPWSSRPRRRRATAGVATCPRPGPVTRCPSWCSEAAPCCSPVWASSSWSPLAGVAEDSHEQRSLCRSFRRRRRAGAEAGLVAAVAAGLAFAPAAQAAAPSGGCWVWYYGEPAVEHLDQPRTLDRPGRVTRGTCRPQHHARTGEPGAG